MKKLYSIILFALVVTTANAQGTWMKKADFGGFARYGAVGFSIASKGYIGLGHVNPDDGIKEKNGNTRYQKICGNMTRLMINVLRK